MATKNVLIFAEQRGDKLRKVAFEAATAGSALAQSLGGEVQAVVVGGSVSGIAGELGAYGVKTAFTAEHPELQSYAPEAYTAVVSDLIKTQEPAAVIFPASALGKDLAPRVAACLGVGLMADCTALDVADGRVVARRPAYAGKVTVTVRSNGTPQLASIRPNVFTAMTTAEGAQAAVESVPVSTDMSALPYKVKEVKAAEGGKMDLTEADVIVSGGRGMQAPENYKLIEELADVLGGVVGASRAAVDAGWRPHSDQVGQTGKTVSPSLYVACGISGAIQHLAGMRSSKCIVAINKDPDAPIFEKADYGIVGDVFEVVPALTEAVKKAKG